jgi:hypothetical protein
MQQRKPCHFLLTIPSQQQADKAQAFAVKIYQRVLASWAQDTLQQLPTYRELNTPRELNTHREAA